MKWPCGALHTSSFILPPSSLAVRQHLYALQKEGLVTAEQRPVPIGRPAKYWQLTRKADSLLPEAYAELNVALIEAVKNTFGAEGLTRVLRGGIDLTQPVPPIRR